MAWKHDGSSANWLTYRNEGADPPERADVIVCTTERVETSHPGASRVVAVRRYYQITFWRDGVEVGKKEWRPAKKPNPIAPSPRTIARLCGQIAPRLR